MVVCDEGRFLSFSRSWPRAFWRSAENIQRGLVRRVAQAAACVVGIRALCPTAPSETLSVVLFFATFRRAPHLANSRAPTATPLHRYTLPLAAAKPPVLPNSPLFKTHTSLRLIKVSHPARPFMTATPTHNPAGQSRALSEHGRVGTAAGAVHQGRRQPSQGPGAFVVESGREVFVKRAAERAAE